MKKLFTIFLMVLAPMISQATAIKAVLNSNQTLEGSLLSYSDTLVVMKPAFYHEKRLELTPENVRYFIISGLGQYNVENGIFVLQNKKKEKLETAGLTTKDVVPTVQNPNLMIGNALKITGEIALNVGVPCLVAGIATCIAGHVMTNNTSYSASITDMQKASKLLESSYYILPIGASLTIVGIPLYIQGKKIMELNLNYTGNGLGLALNF